MVLQICFQKANEDERGVAGIRQRLAGCDVEARSTAQQMSASSAQVASASERLNRVKAAIEIKMSDIGDSR
jgi:hypothetical protein